jgi:DNA-binding IclR family transcriptional regulator
MRNISRGLASRTKIIQAMEQGKAHVPDISERSKLGKACVSYHLKLLLKRKVVSLTQTGRTGRWTLTKYSQEKLAV